MNYYSTETYYSSFAGTGEFLNSPYSSKRIKKIVAIDKVLHSYKYFLTPNNLLHSSFWREQGTLFVELFFVRRSVPSIFPGGTDLLIPLSNSEQHLVEVILQQPEKMVSTEETLRRMEEWAKKKKKIKPTSTSTSSPLSSSSERGKKEKKTQIELGNNKRVSEEEEGTHYWGC